MVEPLISDSQVTALVTGADLNPKWISSQRFHRKIMYNTISRYLLVSSERREGLKLDNVVYPG